MDAPAFLGHQHLPLRGGGQFALVGNGGAVFTSPQGDAWSGYTAGPTQRLHAVAWNDQNFVAVGYDGNIFASLDGASWTQQTSNTTRILWGIAWGGGTFVVVGDNGTVLTSPDGQTWTPRSSGTPGRLCCVAWSGDTFVAAGDGGDIRTSPDGVTWTVSSSGVYAQINAVAWGGGQFVAAGLPAPPYLGGYECLLTSPDGVTWTRRSSGAPRAHQAIAAGGGRFVIVGASGSIITSPDGVAWTTRTSGTTAGLNAVVYNGIQFVAAGDGGVILGSGSALPALTVQSSNPAAGVTVASSSNHGGATPYAVGVAAGATVALEAPEFVGAGAERKQFAGWAGDINSVQRTVTFTLDGSMMLTATYVDAPGAHTLTYSAGPGGSVTGDSPQMVPDGGNGTEVTAVPGEGAVFAGWSDGLKTPSRTDTAVQADLEVTARFASTGGVDIDWYIDHGFTPEPGRTWADLDGMVIPGRTLTLCQEFIAMTDPNHPASLFRVVRIVPGSPPQIIVEPSSPLRRYTLQHSSSLTPDSWTDIEGQTRVPGGTPLIGIEGAGRIFYRVRVELP